MQMHTIGYASNHFSEETMLESGLVGHTYTTDTKNEALENSLQGSSDTMGIQKTISMASKETHAQIQTFFSMVFWQE